MWEYGQFLVCRNLCSYLINGFVKYDRIKDLMSKCSGRNNLEDIQPPPLLSVTFVQSLRKYLCFRSKKIPGPPESMCKSCWPFLWHPCSWTPPLRQCQKSRRNERHRKGRGVCVCVLHISSWGFLVVSQGNELGFFNDYLQLIRFL